ncbi:lactonase family protein [Actibacterium sp.]|uniref:lactonase family protein n=1 Tax=Actibacterium sp. TaxID=1872125 RepID=UPI0035679867
MTGKTIVYASLGPELWVYDLDTESASLTHVTTHCFDEVVQYAWPTRDFSVLYVAISGAGPMAEVERPNHAVIACHILSDGALAPFGQPVRLDHRPLHITLDPQETHLLAAYNIPPMVTVHRLGPNREVGDEVEQDALDFGETVHQVRVTPGGDFAIVPACAHHDNGLTPGRLDIFAYADGKMTPAAQLVPDPERAAAWQSEWFGAHGFAARHVDFHPSRPWMYLCLERQSEIALFDYDSTGVAPRPRFIKSALEGGPTGPSAQLASAIHVHPNGRFVYVSNRAWDTEQIDGKPVFVGGVNDITVFEIDPDSGEPTLIQHADTGGIFPRTFSIDPTGKLLVAGNEQPGWLPSDDGPRRVTPGLVVFRIGDDGCLTRTKKIDFPDNGEVCFWTGIVSVALETNQDAPANGASAVAV